MLFLQSPEGKTRQPNDQSSNPRSPTTSEASSSRKQEISSPKPPSFAIKNIQGQNTIICREFKIDSPKTFDFLGSFRSINQLPIYPLPEIAFIGRSNVGKSSLINCLTNLNKKVVITSKTPGRTQGINLIKCNDREGDICILADLPGYGFAKISKELQRDISNFVNEYIMQRDALRLCIVLLDARREPLESDYNTLKSLAENGIPFTIVLTKSDLVSKTELPKAIKKIQELYALPEGQPVAFSATTGAGRKEVWRLIKEGILDDGSEEDEEDDENNLEFEVPDFSGIRSSK